MGFIQGLLKGLGITFKEFFHKAVTEQYPEVKPKLPARSHGSFAFDKDKCIACGLCANACPNRVIKLKTAKDEHNKRRLTEYILDLPYCLFCGFCVESCPTGAIRSTPEFEMAKGSREELPLVFYRANQGEGPAQNKEGEGKGREE